MSGLPYPGLRPFRKDEADIFFGREEQVDQLLKRLGESRFLAVVGPSGCGKSSLVQTGLLNALETGFLVDAGVRWRIASMRPGNRPMGNLVDALLKPDALELERGERALRAASALAGVGSSVKLEDAAPLLLDSPSSSPEARTPDPGGMLLATLRRGPLGLVETLKETPIPQGSSLLLLVDQFEEIFRYREQFSTDEAGAFVALLLASAQQREVSLYVVITMRTDFLGDCALFTGLPEALNDGQFLTPRLTREQCRQAIVAPARVFGGRVEPALENRLLNDMGTDPDQLPLLQHALMRLWTLASQKGKPVTLTLADYEAIGGLQEALSRHADEAYGELTESRRKIAEVMFRSLYERSAAKHDTRRPVRLQQVADIAEAYPEEVMAVAEAFRRPDRSFLTPPAGVMLTPNMFLDISHESLIRQWKRMRGWAEEEAESAATYRRLLETARLWQAKKAALWDTPDLEIALDWRGKQHPNEFWAERYGGRFALAKEFLDSSQREQEKKRQQAESKRTEKIRLVRNLAIVFAFLFLAMGILFLWALNQKRIARARQLATSADSQLRIDPQLSVLLTVEAVKTKPIPEAQAALRVALGKHYQRQILQGHEGSVSHAAFSPDGKIVVTASGDNTARLWDVSSGTPRHVLQHEGPVTHAAFSPDGKTVVTASLDNTARLWDTSSGENRYVLRHEGSVTYVAFSPDGKTVVTACFDNTARLWDASSGENRYVLRHEGSVTYVAFSPDGKTVLTASFDNTARLWDTSSGTPRHVLQHEGPVTHAAFSPDGKTVLTASFDNTARLWDTSSGTPRHVLQHEGPVYHAAFSPDGQIVVTASGDNTARLWDTSSGENRYVLRHETPVTHAAFSPDGNTVVTASEDNTARLWDASSGEKKADLRGHEDPLKHAAFSPDGNTVVTASLDNTARLWDASSGRELQVLRHEGSVTHAAFSHDGKTVVTASFDNTARLWDTSSGENRYVLRHEGPVTYVAFSPDGKTVLTASFGNTARLWDVSSGTPRHVLQHEGPVTHAAFSPDGKTVLTASFDNTARLWDVSSGTPRHVLQHEGPVTHAAFSPDGKTVLTASGDYTARLWDVSSGTPRHVLQHEGPVTHAAFSPDGKTVVTASEDNKARLWDASTGTKLHLLQGHKAPVTHAAFSPDGNTVVTASEDNTARLWDTRTGRELQVLRHAGAVPYAAFSPDGRIVLTASGDKTVRLWDASTGRELYVLHHEGAVYHAAFSHDGKLVVTASGDKTVKLWRCEVCYPLQELLKLAKDRQSRNLTNQERQRYLP